MIYFDNAATAMPHRLCNVDSAQHNPMTDTGHTFNASSPHKLGIIAERTLREARSQLASILGCDANEIVFTSGGTESNNLAILGYTLASVRQGVNLLTAPYEHPSIIKPMQFAYERGWASSIEKKCLNDSIKLTGGNTLVSVSHINHETGDINDIKAISSTVKKTNPKAVIHVDGAQSFCKEIINLDDVDMYSFSGHKFHGPPGIGGLWVRKGLRIISIMHGGGQEGGMRSGTENVAGIVQMTTIATHLQKKISENRQHVSSIRAILLSLKDILPHTTFNSRGASSPYILNMSFLGIKGEVLVHALSDKGLYVSMGAACQSRKNKKTALEFMGYDKKIAESAVRFSFSPYNTMDEAKKACDIIINEVTRLRKIMA